MKDYIAIKNQLKEEILAQMDLSREVSDTEVGEIIDQLILTKSKHQYLGLAEKKELRQELFFAIRKLDILQELVDDTEVTEIMVNGTDSIFIEKKGHLFLWEKTFESKEKVEDVVQQIVARSNRVVNEASPIVDARLENGARVNVVLNPVALNGPILTIRRFPDKPIQMEDLISFGAIDEVVAVFLKKLVSFISRLFYAIIKRAKSPF